MLAKTELNTLLNKKMDRRDFLRNVAIGLVAVSGLTAALRAFAPAPSAAPQTAAASPRGYGDSAYGGTKTS